MCVLWHHGRGRRGDASAWSKGRARVVCERARGLADVSEAEVEVTEEGSQRSRRSRGLRRGHETNSSLLMWLETTGNEEPGQRACLSHTGCTHTGTHYLLGGLFKPAAACQEADTE